MAGGHGAVAVVGSGPNDWHLDKSGQRMPGLGPETEALVIARRRARLGLAPADTPDVAELRQKVRALSVAEKALQAEREALEAEKAAFLQEKAERAAKKGAK